jgi:hypothetical protein
MQALKTAALAALCAFALGACDQLQQQAAAPGAAIEAAPAAPAEAASAGPAYVGTWAVNAADCSAPQEAENAPYVFHADGYNQHEAHCTWANVQDISATSWRIAAACQVEGDEASLGWDISVDGDTMQMVPGPRLVRCPG